jgi:hypothetical protein
MTQPLTLRKQGKTTRTQPDMAIIDTLKLARALRDKGGFTQEAADATPQALNDALGADVATKADVERLQAATKADIERLQAATQAEIALVRADIDRLDTTLKSEVARLDGKITVLMWAVGVNAALTIAILGVLLHH